MTRAGGKSRRKTCKTCGAPGTETRISINGYCSDCGLEAIAQAAREMQAKSGPAYDEWCKAMRRAARNATRKP